MPSSVLRPAHLALFFAAATPIHAASFPCTAAHSPQEHAICADPKLSAADEQLAAAYRHLRSTLSPTAAAEVQSDQREWLLWLNQVCAPTSLYQGGIGPCLTSVYRTRLHQLTSGYIAVAGLVFYPRAHFALTPEPPGNSNSPQDPGFSIFQFSWPEIDTPNEQASAWNAAVLSRAQRLSSFGRSDPGAFSTTFEGGGDVNLFSNLRAANQRLIVVDLGNMGYSYGAAHPNTGIVTFSWWLGAKRPLNLGDIFNTGWQAHLVPLISTRLKARLGDAGSLYTDQQTLRTIAETASSIDAWTPSSTGLTITFGQYAVASYAEGMPEVSFSWAELKPWLNPSLNPATLPPPIPRPQP